MTPFIAVRPADWTQIEAGHQWLSEDERKLYELVVSS